MEVLLWPLIDSIRARSLYSAEGRLGPLNLCPETTIMERLTPERGERTWRLFHIGWYVNFLCFLLAVVGALFFMHQVLSGVSEESGDTAVLTDITLMSGLMVIAVILLMGAGITRYQARLESQNLEIKMAISALRDQLDAQHDAAAIAAGAALIAAETPAAETPEHDPADAPGAQG
jgi:hypothetical protein